LTGTDRYPTNVFWSDEDEGFIAVAPDLPGCSAFGESQHEALTELQSAIAAWIEAARAAGNPIPEPSQPALDNFYSGKILVRMPKSLHAQLAQGAKTEAASLNQYIVFLLTWATTHRTLTADWTSTVGLGPTYYGPVVMTGAGISSPRGTLSAVQIGVPQVFAWASWDSSAIVSSSTLAREPIGIMIPQSAPALGTRTA